MRKLCLVLFALTASIAVAQSWSYGPPSGFQYTRFDGEYFPGTGRVYFLGGRLADGSTDGNIWSYDPVGQIYDSLGLTMTTPVSNYQVALLRDSYDLASGDTYGLYIFGGRDNSGNFLSSVQVYYPRSNRVRTVSTDPYPNSTSGVYYIPDNAPVYQNKAYVLGGYQTSATPHVSNATCVYDPLAAAGSRWSQLDTLHHRRGYIMAAMVDSFLYACGGDTTNAGGDSLHAVNVVERLNLNNPTGWTARTAMPETADEAQAFGFSTGTPYYISSPGDLAQKIIIAGHGEWVNEDSLCFSYDAAADVWSHFPNLLRASRNHAGALIPGISGLNGIPGIWIWGGRHNADATVGDTSQYFQLQYRSTTVEDVGCTRIIAPLGIVDSNSQITPACSVYNYGTEAESYNIRMKIGTFYDTIAAVANHAPSTGLYVTFPTWSVRQPKGSYAVSCSTELAGDMDSANDRQTESVRVIVPQHDVGVRVLLVPTGIVDSGTVVTPACSVYNYGGATETYRVGMLIGGSYDTSAQVTGHAPGTALYVTFPTWTALARGNYAVSCSTRLTGDQNPYNDRATASGRVRVLDVSADSILRPVLQVTLNDTVYPLVLVSNHGTDTARFSVAMEIGSSWRQARGKTLAAGAQDTAGFPKWIAQPLGKYFVGCSLFLAGDMLPGNNKIGDSVTVAPGTGISRNAGPTTPSKFALYGAQPNPTRDQAQIRYDLAEAGFSRMAIYDTRGRLVCELVAGQQASGHYQIAWNCRDAFNRRVAPGVYFCRLLAGSHQATSKVLIAN